MNREKLSKLYKKYDLSSDDVFKHQHYMIITRAGIDKIQAIEGISINYDVINSLPNFAVVRANASKGEKEIETFGSALKGETHRDGNCNTWYVMEMAEKRAMSRADSDAPDAKGKFRDLSASGLASWLIKSRRGNLSRIISSLNQQIVFNRKKNPKYAAKMRKTQDIVRKRLGKKKNGK